ncbi:amidase family protein [Mycobacterium xenopi 4042]|uniref:Amidase family protein n=1 Tax=Mycobacterium xenopi 4042 TaxID=1299334 RepID=X7Z9U4_MYCXE|nr:amidase family protein [Mycobacterium xenopi 4042]
MSRTVRDTAALLDAVRGPGIGDTVIAPPPSRPYIDEVGAEPGRLRIGLLDHHPRGSAVAPECTAAARSAAALLESLGHAVEHAWPTALSDETLSLNPWMGDFVLPSTRLFWDAAECGAVGRG